MNQLVVNTLHELFEKEIQDIYSAEKQLVQALPKLIEAASNSDLKEMLDRHLIQTGEHVSRIEKIADNLDIPLNGVVCLGMKGLLAEGNEVTLEIDDPATKDAAIIGAAQRVEHYEIAAYGTALAHAQSMKHKKEAALLQKTLDEEGSTNKKLTKLAEKSINKKALHA
jgi:ferritin-like metal-binding protein YciE